MNILVCLSRVPDTATKIAIGSDSKSINSQGVKYVSNPYDEFAIEEGLRQKEKNGGTVTVVTVGGEASTEILRTALAMGADSVILVESENPQDSFFVAQNLADVAKDLNPDIIFLGKQSVDFDSLQMPSLLAELLDIPAVSVVSKLNIDGTKVVAERDIEGGKEIVETSLPCIISAQKGLNEPRYPKLPAIMKAKSKPIDKRQPVATELQQEIISMETPSRSRLNKIFGSSDEEIGELVRLLHEEAKVI